MRTPYPNMKRQKGFTLLELLVVVSVLASLAGIAAIAMDDYEEKAQEQLVHVEMKRIANAIYRFKADTGYFPKEGIFTADKLFGSSDTSTDKTDYENANNMSWLFSAPQLHDTNGDGDTDGSDSSPTNRLEWNATIGRGWHGPYITIESKQLLSTDNCELDATGSEYSFDALADTFNRIRNYSESDSCFIVRDKGIWIPREYIGMPYQYNIAYTNSQIPECTTSCVALISAGDNGIHDETDDVIVLRSDG